MLDSLSTQEQSPVSAATVLLSQCSLQDRSEVIPRNSYCVVRQFATDSTSMMASRIHRRNAVGNLFEGIDLAVIKQLAELGDQKLQ